MTSINPTAARRARRAPRTGSGLPLARRMAGLAWRLTLLLGLSGTAFAQQHYWYDGDARRPLWVASDVVADFSTPRAEKARVLRPALLAKGGDASATTGSTAGAKSVSPVFRDGRTVKDRPRALPGGVIVTLKTGSSDAQRQALFARHGLARSRALGEAGGVWMVETPPGLTALDLANRLYESGDFAAAAPNWWQPRALK